MKSVRYLCIAALLALVPGAGAQDVQASASTQKESAPKSNDGPMTIFGGEFSGTWHADGSVSVSESYDDNAFAQQGREGQAVSATTLGGTFTAAVEKQRWNYSMSYSPSFSIYKQLPELNGFSQTFAQQMGLVLGKHTKLNWGFSASLVPENSGLPNFATSFGSLSLPTLQLGALQNNANIVPLESSLTLTKQYSKRDTFESTVRGNGILIYGGTSSQFLSGNFQEQYGGYADMGLQHAISEVTSVGVSVSGTYLASPATLSHMWSETAGLTFQRRVGNRFSLSGEGGIDFQQNKLYPTARKLDYEATATLTEFGLQHSIALTASHRPQLGYSIGSIQTDTVAATASRNFYRRYSLAGAFTYGRGNSFGIAGTGNSSYTAQGTFGFKFSDMMNMSLQYSHIKQDGFIAAGAGNFDRNVYAAVISRTFRILGR